MISHTLSGPSTEHLGSGLCRVPDQISCVALVTTLRGLACKRTLEKLLTRLSDPTGTPGHTRKFNFPYHYDTVGFEVFSMQHAAHVVGDLNVIVLRVSHYNLEVHSLSDVMGHASRGIRQRGP